MSDPIEMYHFIEECKNQHLTLSDVKNLKVGDTLDVVIWDGNWEEYWAWKTAKDGHPYLAEEFFKENRHKLTYQGNLTWDIHYSFGETILHPVHLNTQHLKTYCKWAPVDKSDDKIHITSEYLPRGQKTIPVEWKAIHMHWTEFPDSTRVGWRGPIMLWDKLENMPKVYNKHKYYGEDID